MMYASMHLQKFNHEVDPFLKVISNSSSFHNEIVRMTVPGYLMSDNILIEEVYEWQSFFLQNGCKLNKGSVKYLLIKGAFSRIAHRFSEHLDYHFRLKIFSLT